MYLQSTSKVFWLTGLSGAGKSRLAKELKKNLNKKGVNVTLIDGDDFRKRHSPDLGYSDQDRTLNAFRMLAVAKYHMKNSIVIVAAITPLQKNRDEIRASLGTDNYVEVYLNTPLSVCEQRDPKALYRKARLGLIKNFTGISSIYQIPQSPDFTISYQETPEFSAEYLSRHLINFI